MIKTFADKKTRALFEGERVRALQSFTDQAVRRLRALQSAVTLRELQDRPGNRFEMLRGERAGRYSIRINAQWRLCFHWEPRDKYSGNADPLDLPGDATEVEIVDYH